MRPQTDTRGGISCASCAGVCLCRRSVSSMLRAAVRRAGWIAADTNEQRQVARAGRTGEVVTGGHGVNGARVLVISGDDFLAEAVVHALRNDNHEVERTPSWKSAERMLPDLRPQLLVIDAESEGVSE